MTIMGLDKETSKLYSTMTEIAHQYGVSRQKIRYDALVGVRDIEKVVVDVSLDKGVVIGKVVYQTE